MEAGNKLLAHLFGRVGAKEIFGDCDIWNENLWRTLERLGLQQANIESYKKDAHGNPLLISIHAFTEKRRIQLHPAMINRLNKQNTKNSLKSEIRFFSWI